MPLVLLLLALLLLAILVSVVLIPVALMQRYRMGTVRRRAWPWLASLNAAGITLSLVLFFAGAAFTNIWVPHALAYSALGAIAGMSIGLLGLVLTRWEPTGSGLYYTPNRWLVLAITLAVAGRLAYGLWRGWHAWTNVGAESWLVASGTAGTLAAGALILGYYFAYWIGVRRRVRRYFMTR